MLFWTQKSHKIVPSLLNKTKKCRVKTQVINLVSKTLMKFSNGLFNLNIFKTPGVCEFLSCNLHDNHLEHAVVFES